MRDIFFRAVAQAIAGALNLFFADVTGLDSKSLSAGRWVDSSARCADSWKSTHANDFHNFNRRYAHRARWKPHRNRRSLQTGDAMSDAVRERVIEWYRITLLSRGDDKSETQIVVVMQRVHQNDLVGYLQEQGASRS